MSENSLETNSSNTSELFWREQHAEVPATEIPLDFPRVGVQSFMRDSVSVELGTALADRLSSVSESHTSTASTFCATVLATLLFRYCDQQEVVFGALFGSRDAGGDAIESDRAQLLPLRVGLTEDTSGRAALAQVQRSARLAFAHNGEALRALLDELSLSEPERAPLFQVAVAWLDDTQPESPNESDLDHARADLERCDAVVVVHRRANGVVISCEYDTDLIEAQSADRFLGHFSQLLEALLLDPNRAIQALPLITDAEREQLRVWNATEVDYPQAACLHTLFERQVAATPTATAVEFGDRSVTYQEFNEQANRIAHRLQELGVGRNDLVGIFIERSDEMLAAIYAVEKAGAAYVPLDPEYPGERLGFMLEDASAKVIISHEDLLARLPAHEAAVLCLDRDSDTIARQSASNPDCPAELDDLAYVIFTSGSTGRPKGVMNSHRGICNRLLWMQQSYPLDHTDAVLQKTPLSFDVSVWELFWPLQVGARLVIANPGDHRDPSRLVDLISSRQITTMHFVPSMLQLFVEEPKIERCESLRQVFCSGEALPFDLVQRFFTRLQTVQLHNLYGPTEAAVDVSYWECKPNSALKIVPIGRPVANTQLYILDPLGEPVPIGVAGELHIGGVQVARGYRNREDLSAAAFIADPFSDRAGSDKAGARLYKTGDLARFLSDGNIEYLGRIDHQVKLRGQRIELGEIEFRLLQQADIREAVVMLREDSPGDQRLVAYAVSNNPGNKDLSASLDVLRRTLPDYMIPSHIVGLQSMPLSPNGKVDRKALPSPPRANTNASEVPLDAAQIGTDPGSIESIVSAVWREVLGLDQVGPDQNFFDLGGHSLLVARVRQRLQELLACDLSVADMFKYPTVRSLTQRLLPSSATTSMAAARSAESPAPTSASIAIVGLACRLPGAADADAFWKNLASGVESIQFFADDELLEAGIPESHLDQPNYVKARSVLPDADAFDAGFFGYSPREAEVIDPQQRVFLECAWHALEDAGFARRTRERNIGVYAGAGMNTYLVHNLQQRMSEAGVVDAFQLMIGNDKDFLPTRVSYKLDLTGPSINVQTACSTSLVAVHTACRALLEGACDIALAGGTTVHVPQITGYHYQDGMILSSDGHCRAFDARADGTVFGSGVAAVVLKRLDQALEDGDQIHAVIRGTAINNDGSLKVGYTAPSVEGQAGVIAAAQAEAGVSANDISYIETHGTGTSLGDPIEIAALTQAFRNSTDRRGFCGLGSVKSNIGHTDAAAGVTGLIKTVLALKNELMPPSLHFENPNPEIDFQNSPFFVVAEPTPWPRGEKPRLAGVSSFGIGGTNSHAIVEEAPALAAPVASGTSDSVVADRDYHLVKLSARNEAALKELANRYALALGDANAPAVADFCFSANTGRADFDWRATVIGTDANELAARLAAYASDNQARGVYARDPEAQPPASGRTAFLMTGQGAQRIGMGRELYARSPVFKGVLDECEAILAAYLPISLKTVMFDGEADANGPLLHDTRYTQPALFALEYALARLWQSWGVEPHLLLGHSVGEYAAACIAGVFSLEDGLKLIAHRGRLMSELPRDGAMRAVMAGEARVVQALQEEQALVSLAAVNGPQSCVISGDATAVARVAQQLESAGVESRALTVSHAFHSPLMEPMLSEFRDIAATVEFSSPKMGLISNVTGALAGDAVTTPEYWCRHIREPVRFAAGIQSLADAGAQQFIEAGPHPTLIAMARSCLNNRQARWLASLRDGVSDWSQLLESVGQHYVEAGTVDWDGLDAPYQRRRVSLPVYPFQRQRYSVDPASSSAAHTDPDRHPLLGRRVALPFSQEHRFETHFELDSPAYVKDHRVFGVLVVAGASHCALLLMGARDVLGSDACRLEEIYFLQPFTLSESGSRVAQLIASSPDDQSRQLQLVSLKESGDAADAEDWVQHLRARLKPLDVGPGSVAKRLAISDVLSRCTQRMDHDEFYGSFWVQGDDAGPSFRWLESVWGGDDEAIACTTLPDIDDDVESFQLHPGVIEACFQVLRSCREFESQRLLAAGGHIYVPFAIEAFEQYKRPASNRLWCYARMRASSNDQSVIGDVLLVDEDGDAIASIEGFECRRLPQENLLRSLHSNSHEWLYAKRWLAEPLADIHFPPATNPLAANEGAWVIYTDEEHLSESVAAQLAEQGERCIIARAASRFAEIGDDRFELDPYSAKDFEALITRLHVPSANLGDSSQSVPIKRVLHISGAKPADSALEDQVSSPQGTTAFDSRIGATSVSAVHLAQALLRQHWAKAPQLIFVTRGAQSVGAQSAVDPSQSPLWGLARVLRLEHPELGCACVDLDLVPPSASVLALLEEPQDQSLNDQVAIRNGQRFAAKLGRLRVPANSLDVTAPNASIRADATYLVTGGLGGLGQHVAAWLAEHGARHLVLIGRRGLEGALPEPLQTAQSSGAELRIMQADVADSSALQNVFETIDRELPPLAGILHTAGTLDDGMFLQQRWERFETVYMPKVRGARLLHEHTRERQLDFFICFSSATATLGAQGQSNYAAANAYLDSLCEMRRAQGLPALSIAWGPWGEAGMAARLGERERRRASDQGWSRIDLQSGLGLLQEFIEKGDAIPATVSVLPLHWGRFAKSLFGGQFPGFLAGFQPAQVNTSSSRGPAKRGDILAKLADAPPAQRVELLKDYVSRVVADLLGHTEIDPQHGFTEMGMDSLMSVEFRDVLQTGLEVSLSSTFAFDYANIEDVVGYLDGLMFATENTEQSSVQEPADRSAAAALPELEQSDLESVDLDAAIESELAALESKLDTRPD